MRPIFKQLDLPEYKQSLDYKIVSDGPELNSISVDAASSGNPGVMEYQGVDTNTKEILFKMGPFNNATNNIGEFLALAHGIAILEKKSENCSFFSKSICIALYWTPNSSSIMLIFRPLGVAEEYKSIIFRN